MRKAILAVFMGMALCLPALAQETPMADMLRLTNTMREVSLQTNNDTLELVVSGVLMDGCIADSIIETQRVGENYFVDIYRNFPADQPCTRALLPFDATVDVTDLMTLDAEAMLPVNLIVNDRLYRLEYAQVEPMPDGSAPLVAPLLTELVRTPADVSSITPLQAEDGTWGLRIQGVTGDTCQRPVVRAYPSFEQEGEITIEAYAALDIASTCLAGVMGTFDVVVPIGAEVDANTTFNLYGVTFTMADSNGAEPLVFIVQQLPIESAEATLTASQPPTITINASGTTDGCPQQAALVIRQLVDNTLSLQVIRILPENQACTLILKPLNVSLTVPAGSFTAGEVMITVNDTITTSVTIP